METSLYIHIPFCVSKCDYCDFFSIGCGKKHIPHDYVEALCNEILFKISEYKVEKWNTIFIGGGTPSLLNQEQLQKIFNAITSVKNPYIKECTIEVNPDDITNELISIYSDLPITRISCGIQSMNQIVLKQSNRRSDLPTVIQALNIISKNWKRNFSVDIISGLPGQTTETFTEGLSNLLKFGMDHISMYSLTIEENTPLYKKIENGTIEYDFDYADQMWLKGREILLSNGFNQYEVSNFSRPGKECIHNLVYWQLENYIGCGAGATGTIYGEKSLRTTNLNDIEKYINYWHKQTLAQIPESVEEIDLETQKFEFLMMGLRTTKGISSQKWQNRFHQEMPQNIIKKFQLWSEKKLANIQITNNETFYSLNQEGILFLNRFLIEE